MPLLDFAFLTGLREECKQLRKLLPGLTEIPGDGVDPWYRGTIESDSGQSYEVAASFQSQMGPLPAASLTHAAIERWDPAHIVLVGIAGSFDPSWVRLGDVVVSQQVFYYDQAHAAPDGLRYRPQGYPCSPVLIRQIERHTLDADAFGPWRKACRVKGNWAPKVHFGTVASGSLVITDKGKRDELYALHGKLLGTEMEGAGMMWEVFNREIPTNAVLVKGVSDYADPDKAALDAGQTYRTAAARNAIRLVLATIRRGRFRQTCANLFDLDSTPGGFDEARHRLRQAASPGHSFHAFPRLVLTRGPLTDLTIEVEPLGGVLRELVVEFKDYSEGIVRKEHLTGPDWTVKVTKPLAAEPIGVYLLCGKGDQGGLRGIRFGVRAGARNMKCDWLIADQEG